MATGKGWDDVDEGVGREQGTQAHTAPASSPPCPHPLPRKLPNVPSRKVPRALRPFFNPRLMFLWTLSRYQRAFSPLLGEDCCTPQPTPGKPAVWDRLHSSTYWVSPKQSCQRTCRAQCRLPFIANQDWPAARASGPLRGSYSLPVLLQPPVSQQGEWGNHGAE